MKRNVITAFIATGLIVMACKPKTTEPTASVNDTAKMEVTEAQQTKERVYNVKTMVIEPQNIERTMDFTSTLSAFEEVYFAPAAPGRIDRIFVQVGDKVSKGQVLAEMDKTQLVQTKIQMENAEINLKRLETLLETNSVSQQQYDQVKTQYDVAKSGYEFLKENTTLRSPISGIVTARYFEETEMFSGGPNTQAGKAALLTIMQINPLKAKVNVSESLFPKVTKGMNVSVTSDIYKDQVFEGKVYRIHPTIDPMTRTFMVEVSLPNANEVLRPGMFARVNFGMGETTAVLVPSIAVLTQEGTNTKYIFVSDNGVAHRFNVKTGKRFDDKIEIISDKIIPGQQLIIAGQGNLMEGYRVNTIQ